VGLSDQDRRAELLRAVDDLLEQAADLRRQWEQIEALLDDAPAAAPGAGTVTAGSAEEADPRLLIALDLAMSGRSRDEAERYLTETFGSEGTAQILDEVFDEHAG
jgi:hypothetical protein